MDISNVNEFTNFFEKIFTSSQNKTSQEIEDFVKKISEKFNDIAKSVVTELNKFRQIFNSIPNLNPTVSNIIKKIESEIVRNNDHKSKTIDNQIALNDRLIDIIKSINGTNDSKTDGRISGPLANYPNRGDLITLKKELIIFAEAKINELMTLNKKLTDARGGIIPDEPQEKNNLFDISNKAKRRLLKHLHHKL
ncbi:MAG: hypothetical protein H0W88_04330 [Parachlamydiaceae bacterium]|nr:hypothetical protein [Parachlamydiaceae bacterium]